jgi:hypothetical protein
LSAECVLNSHSDAPEFAIFLALFFGCHRADFATHGANSPRLFVIIAESHLEVIAVTPTFERLA